MSTPHSARFWLALSTSIALTACGGGGSGPATPSTTSEALPQASAAPAPTPTSDSSQVAQAPAPTQAPATAEGKAADCFNAALYEPSASLQLSFQQTGGYSTQAATWTYAVAEQPSGPFQGERAVRFTELYAENDGHVDIATMTTYFRMEGSDMVQKGSLNLFPNYGGWLAAGDYGVVEAPAAGSQLGPVPPGGGRYSPVVRDSRFQLAAGETQSLSWQMTPVYMTHRPLTETRKITYRGQETVTVPAGTYVACRFDETFTPSSVDQPVNSTWIAKGIGIPVKFVGRSGSDRMLELKPGSRLNGSPL